MSGTNNNNDSSINNVNNHVNNHVNNDGKTKQLIELEEKMRSNYRIIQLLSAMSDLNGNSSNLIMSGINPSCSASITPSSESGEPSMMINSTTTLVNNKSIRDALHSDEIVHVACMARRSDGKQCTKPKHTKLNPDTIYCNVHQTNRVYGRVDEAVPKEVRLRYIKNKPIINCDADQSKLTPSNNRLKPGRKKKSNKNKPKPIINLPDSTNDTHSNTRNKSKNKTIYHNTSTTNNNTDANNLDKCKPVPKKRGRKRKHPVDPRFNNPDYIVMWPEIINGEKRLVDRNNHVFTYDTELPVYLGTKTVDNQLISI